MLEPETLRQIREGWNITTSIVDMVLDGVERYATKRKPVIDAPGRVKGLSQADVDTYLRVRQQIESADVEPASDGKTS